MEESGRGGAHDRAVTPEVPYHDLWTKPFRENTDPSFLWLGPTYRDAFATLRSAVLQNAGVLLLTGDVGTGKTMLASALADSLRAEGVRVAKIAYAGLDLEEFRNGVAQALALPAGPDTRVSFLAHFGDFLHGAYARREKVLLVIDEAQNLGPEVLDEIEHVARVGREAGRGKVNVINILLVGQADVDAMLRRLDPHCREDPVAGRAHLGPLEPQQVADYVAFRLRVAGADRELFSADAIREVAIASGGVPRLVNRICDCALLVASRRNERVVSADVVRDALGDFGLTAAGGAIGRADRHRPARRSIRRIAYAAGLALAIGLVAVVYHGGSATNIGDDRERENLRPAARTPSVANGAPPAMADPAAGQPATTTPTIGKAPQGEIPEAPKPETARQAAQHAMSAPSGPREDSARLQKMPVPEPRVEPVKPARATTATSVAGPVRVGTSPASNDRSPEAAAGPSGGAPASRRSTETRSQESDDSTAIIDWLLQGNRSAAER